LVVDDERTIMETTARILRRHGYNVLEAASGIEAISLAVEHDIALLLTDSVMPQMSGRDLAQRVGEIRPGTPVLFMSGYREGVVGPQRVIAEGSGLLEKPFTADALIRGIRDALSGGTPGGGPPTAW
jgi:DNA-binding NtrC family response regulator